MIRPNSDPFERLVVSTDRRLIRLAVVLMGFTALAQVLLALRSFR